MPDKDTVLSGTTLPPKADGGFNAQAAYEAFNLFIRTVRDAVQTHQTESTKREQLRTQRETQIEQIRATERILRDYFDRVYAERRENHQLLFAGLDQALKTGDNAALQTVVGGIVDLARTSPLADLGNLGELRRAMEDPNTVFKL
jgi:hypothetical protein